MNTKSPKEMINQTKEEMLAKKSYNFDDLVAITRILRSEEGCAWDREQTHKSIRRDFLEETYEVIEAIDTDNPVLLKEELGDVLLQVVFHTSIEEDAGVFDIGGVADGICKKLILRHPHVFGDTAADNVAKVLENWEKIKSEEKNRKTYTDKLRAIPPMLPALMRAQKVGKKASVFDFPDTDSVMAKVDEELAELKSAVRGGNGEEIFEELGDLLLSVTSLARKLGVDAEMALAKSTDKFISRFAEIESEVLARGKSIEGMKIAELDEIWDENKRKNPVRKP